MSSDDLTCNQVFILLAFSQVMLHTINILLYHVPDNFAYQGKERVCAAVNFLNSWVFIAVRFGLGIKLESHNRNEHPFVSPPPFDSIATQ
jgi:hypothetical protein